MGALLNNLRPEASEHQGSEDRGWELGYLDVWRSSDVWMFGCSDVTRLSSDGSADKKTNHKIDSISNNSKNSSNHNHNDNHMCGDRAPAETAGAMTRNS